MNKLTVAALAFAAISLASTAVNAQVTPAPALGDLILGFQLAGNNTNLEVDLGNYTQFSQTAVLSFNTRLLASNISSTYGGSFASTTSGTGVQWSVAGFVGGVNANPGTGTGSHGRDFMITSTVPQSPGNFSNFGTIVGKLNALTTGGPGISSVGTAAGVTQAGTQYSAFVGDNSNPANSLAGSYSFLENGDGYSYVPAAEQTGAGNNELYSFTNGSNTDMGTFTLSSGGVLTYTGSLAVAPEPSSYALMLLGFGALVTLARLRRKSVVA